MIISSFLNFDKTRPRSLTITHRHDFGPPLNVNFVLSFSVDLSDIVKKHYEIYRTKGEKGKIVTVDCDLEHQRKFKLSCCIEDVSHCTY